MIFICQRVSARFLHGFCTVSKRAEGAFRCKIRQRVQKLPVKNYVVLIKNNDDSKLPSFETNRRLALLISGPRVRVPGGTPKKERRIVRFGVLSFIKRGLDGASPLDKEKHKALYYNKAIRT